MQLTLKSALSNWNKTWKVPHSFYASDKMWSFELKQLFLILLGFQIIGRL